METPIADFCRAYAEADVSRLHVPGHKGVGPLGCEPFDLTEIAGADELYGASGIIARSEENATRLFGTRHTFYSTEGSSHCIRSMLYLAACAAGGYGRKTVLAARNAHKAFLYACALLDLEPLWLMPERESPLCSCFISPARLEARLRALAEKPAAVFVTSPDYLGGIQDIAGLAQVCRRYDVPLLVDNAHGAYLHFLPQPAHPMDLGAAMCCDSAHKTLPVLTGGAYLHIADTAPVPVLSDVRSALALFGSTSPSYLILQSLDLCNRTLAAGYPERAAQCAARVADTRRALSAQGLSVPDTEPFKLVIHAAACGADGTELANRLRTARVECEYADREHVVLMYTPENRECDYRRVEAAFAGFAPRTALQGIYPPAAELPRVCSVREAFFSPHETVPAGQALDRICGAPTVACPPAIPIVVSGERITKEAVCALEAYGVEQVEVCVRQDV